MKKFSKAIFFGVALCLLQPAPLWAFGYEDVVAKAKDLASKEYKAPPLVPEVLGKFTYDQHRDIRLLPEKTLWASKSPKRHFDAQVIHAGGIFNYPVHINIYDSEGVHEYPYSTSDFDFGSNAVPQGLPENMGFGGFRLRFPINKPEVQDEVIVFAGASYFRAVSKDTLYGLSARGLAIDTALTSGEEFPLFKEYWLERPATGSDVIKLYALLDSKRIAGAYEFQIYPGDTTRTRVKTTLIAREPIKEVGIAPLTSMFWIGENTSRPVDEWRPEIHDSDGLLLQNGNGETIWRPLENQKTLRLSMLGLENPKGFGLLQRDRDFRSYEDLETNQERRPSAWIAPIGDWGKGYVKLTEIPTVNEYNDNIVAYWVSSKKLEAGKPVTYEYWLNWNKTGPKSDEMAQVVATRLARDEKAKNRTFVVDFAGELLQNLPAGKEIEANIWTDTNSRLERYHITPNPEVGGSRLTFVLAKDNPDRSEIRVRLWQDGKPLTEIWTYLLEN